MTLRLLDLFCGAGGCSAGYHDAGFHVTGVDIEHHDRYPYKMTEADALDILDDVDLLRRYDVIHASPPCQGYTTMSNRHRGNGGKADSHAQLIHEVRAKLVTAGVPYVIENVPGARRDMINPITLHGGMFGLRVNRPRLFESNLPIRAPKDAPRVDNPVGVYGRHHDGRRLFTRKDGTSQHAARSLEEGQEAMGIDWMAWEDLTEAIPPAYTRWIGYRIIDAFVDNMPSRTACRLIQEAS